MAQPNILLITTDQQRFDTIQAQGNDAIYTPHLNWLADEGVTFERCYSTSPICMAARATIMTGLEGYHTGLTGNHTRAMPMAEHPTLPQLLTAAGYQTRAQGKMHFHPLRAHYGFEYMELPADYYRERLRDPDHGVPKEHGVGENEVEPVISTVDERHSLTYWTVRRSIDFLETRDETRPFFLWTSFTKPHPPFDPTANYWALYANRAVPDPVFGDWSERREEIPAGFLEPTYYLNNVWRLGPEQRRDSKRAYYACITQIDYQLGLLFARMRELGLFQNTWILFTSDHGDNLGDHWMGGKTNFLEGSAHVPLLIRPPQSDEFRSLRGRSCATLTTLADLMPTILKLAGVPVPAVDGRDLMELVELPPQPRWVFGSSCGSQYAAISGDYKYTWTSLGGGELFFDLRRDPRERHNALRDPELADTVAAYRQHLIEFLREVEPERVGPGGLVAGPAAASPREVGRWPGFHSIGFPCDVLH